MASNDRSAGDEGIELDSQSESVSSKMASEVSSDEKKESGSEGDKSCTNHTDAGTEQSRSSSSTHSPSNTTQSDEPTDPVLNHTNREHVDVKIVFNKKKYDVSYPIDETVCNFKKHIEEITGVPYSMQKIMHKGLMQDTKTLREHKVINGAKIMVVGSTVSDVLSVSAPDPNKLREEETAAAAKENLSTQKPHKTVLEKYSKPDDALPGLKNTREPLPSVPLSGMYNKHGGKVRLTFKLESDQVWIGTKERTEKLSMSSIKSVVSEPIHDHPEYHIMGLQLGPTEASRYWVYWVPAQYVDAIKEAILGKWQLF